MKEPYIPLARKFFESPFWKEERSYSKAEAWLDLIRMATFQDETVFVHGRLLKLQRGDLAASLRYLCKRWDWSKSKVECFLNLLKKEAMIKTRNETGLGIISLIKYDTYNRRQDKKQDSEQDTNRTVTRHSQDKSNEFNNLRNKEERESQVNPSPSLPFDSERFSIAWKEWIDHLKFKEVSLSPATLRSVFGELKLWGEERSIKAIAYSIKKNGKSIFEETQNQSIKPKPPEKKIKTQAEYDEEERLLKIQIREQEEKKNAVH